MEDFLNNLNDYKSFTTTSKLTTGHSEGEREKEKDRGKNRALFHNLNSPLKIFITAKKNH